MKNFHTKYPLILALTVLSYLSQAQTGTLVWADEFNYTGSPAQPIGIWKTGLQVGLVMKFRRIPAN